VKLTNSFFHNYFNIPRDKEIFRIGRNFIDYWEDKSIGLAKRRDYGQPLARIQPWAFLFCEPERGGTDTSSTNNIDSMISKGATTTNYGSGTTMNVLCNITTSFIRVVMDWTLSSGSGTISKIALYLYITGQSGTPEPINLHELTQASAMVENQVTWSIWKTASSWATPGGDYSATIVDSITWGSTSTWDEYVLYGAGATNPMSITWGSNFDIILKIASEDHDTTRYVTYATKENASNNPYIEITYELAVVSRHGFVMFQDPAIV